MSAYLTSNRGSRGLQAAKQTRPEGCAHQRGDRWVVALAAVAAWAVLAWMPGSARAEVTVPPENECVRCHLEQEEEDENLAKPPKEWRQSIHHENSIMCNDCHGGSPIGKDEEEAHDEEEAEFIGAPADDDIPQVCGECHIAVHENYMKSKHWLTKKEKRPVCTTCHNAHLIKEATLDLINEKTCSECHKFERSKRIQVAMTATEDKLLALEGRIHLLKSEGMDIRSLEQTHFAQRNLFHRLSHILDLDEVIRIAETVGKDTELLSNKIGEQEGVLSRRKLAGGVLTAFLLLGALGMHFARKSLGE